jgi:hypothetical protein
MATSRLNPVAIPQPDKSGALVVLVVGLPLALLAFLLLAIGRGGDFLMFGTMAVLFLGLAGMFIATNGSLNAQWCTAPGFMTLISSLEFVVIPLSRFVTGDDSVDSLYLTAMAYLLLGFSMFWLACWLLKKPHRFEFVPETPPGNSRVLLAAAVLFALGASASVLRWKLGILGYDANQVQGQTNASAVGGLNTVARMLNLSMLVSGIEVFGKRSKSLPIRFIFTASAVFSLGFGIISGMKIEVLMPIFTLTVMLGITRKRLPKLIWSLPVLFVLLQPFINAYRANLSAGYAAQINTVGGLTSTLTKSIADLASGGGQASLQHRSAFDRYGYRLSDLTLFHNVLQLPSPDLLNGDESIWMAPIYPFIPRVLWKDKPILGKGGRMSESMGYGTQTSTNVPGIADLYVLGGAPGILFGMFIWGACLQLYMNNIGTGLSERGTLFYVTTLFFLTNIEHDIIPLIGGAIESAYIMLILSKIIYGGPLFSLRSGYRTLKVRQ